MPSEKEDEKHACMFEGKRDVECGKEVM